MQRIGYLFEKVIDFANLLHASRAAMRGCGKTLASCRFFADLETEILSLQRVLAFGDYRPESYRFFSIHDPKQRTIAVAPFRDRVVHHAVVQVLTPIYERVFIFDSYATRAGKGTHAAVRRAQQFIRRWPWYLKMDVAKYFDSVRHDTLMIILGRKIKDRRLLALLERIIRNTPKPDKGLPIGNLTSQFLANVYLDPLDHAIKEHMRIRGYLRYMDDFLLFSHGKEELLAVGAAIEEFLDQRLQLKLKRSGTHLNRSRHGVSFLGMRIFPRFMRVRPENRARSIRRAKRRIEAWQSGALDEQKMTQSLQSIAGHLKYFCPHSRIAVPVL